MPSIGGLGVALHIAMSGEWRNGGHRGKLTPAQKKKKAKARKKRKSR